MARYDEDAPHTCEYDDDCSYCGEEHPRSELAWSEDNRLQCAACEAHAEDLATIPDSPVPYVGITAAALAALTPLPVCDACDGTRVADGELCPQCR